MIEGWAYAKVNIGLRVGGLNADGYHPLSGIFQSVDICDRLALVPAEQDAIGSPKDGPVADGMGNLAFRAVAAARRVAGSSQPVGVTLDKSIPTAAGLGGGSADAAAALVMAGEYFGLSWEVLTELAPQLGSDVPFCLVGGTARVSGRGEVVESLDPLTGFALAVVVPPVEISTPAAFRCWDQLGGPTGLRMAAAALPPQLRDEGDLYNDLYPAAARIAAGLDDWRADLEQAWGRAVMLSGSGPSLYGFFLDADEAEGAVDAIPVGARFAAACDLAAVGWRIEDRR